MPTTTALILVPTSTFYEDYITGTAEHPRGVDGRIANWIADTLEERQLIPKVSDILLADERLHNIARIICGSVLRHTQGTSHETTVDSRLLSHEGARLFLKHIRRQPPNTMLLITAAPVLRHIVKHAYGTRYNDAQLRGKLMGKGCYGILTGLNNRAVLIEKTFDEEYAHSSHTRHTA